MRRVTPALLASLLALLLGGADRPAATDLPEGCRSGVTLFCADPSWPTLADPPPPLRRLTARGTPAAPLAGYELPAGE